MQQWILEGLQALFSGVSNWIASEDLVDEVASHSIVAAILQLFPATVFPGVGRLSTSEYRIKSHFEHRLRVICDVWVGWRRKWLQAGDHADSE